MIPRVMALSALQINLIITTAIASTLTAGSITILIMQTIFNLFLLE